jgi:hypothetical protein
MGQRRKHAAPVSDSSFDHTAVNEEQQNDRSLMQGHHRPVLGVHQVVFEVEPSIADRFLEQRQTVLVIAVRPVMSKPADPLASQMCNK